MKIAPDIEIDDAELEFRAIRAGGPGGQNVNKVSTAVQLRFDVRASDSLPEQAKNRILALRDQRLTADGCIVIKAQDSRSQARNREAALERLQEMLVAALEEAPPRKPTRPTKASRVRRLEDKAHRSKLKKSRGQPLD